MNHNLLCQLGLNYTRNTNSTLGQISNLYGCVVSRNPLDASTSLENTQAKDLMAMYMVDILQVCETPTN